MMAGLAEALKNRLDSKGERYHTSARTSLPTGSKERDHAVLAPNPSTIGLVTLVIPLLCFAPVEIVKIFPKVALHTLDYLNAIR